VDVVAVVAVEAGVSVDVVLVVVAVLGVAVAAEPVSSTTLGCSLAVAGAVSLDSSFLQPAKKRVAEAIAAIRKRARDFFIR
jgi:hypothetical protein